MKPIDETAVLLLQLEESARGRWLSDSLRSKLPGRSSRLRESVRLLRSAGASDDLPEEAVQGREPGLFMWTISDSTGRGNIGIKSVIKSVANPSFFRTNFDEQFSELLY